MRYGLLGLILATATPAAAEVYRVERVVTTTGASLLAPGLSPNGWVGGQAQDTLLPAIRLPNGSVIDVPTLGGNRGGIFGINAGDVALGNARTGSTALTNLAFLRAPDGAITVLPAPAGGVQVTTNAINDSNVSVGNFRVASDTSLSRSWRWAPGTGTIELGRPDGFEQSLTFMVNNAGAAVGQVFNTGSDQRAVRWALDGTPTLLGETGSVAYAINQAGVAAGGSGINAAVWLADGTQLDLGTIGDVFTVLYTNRPGPAYGQTVTSIVNPDGSAGTRSDAVVWDPTGGLRLFAPQFRLAPDIASFSLSLIYDSNVRGQLIGFDCTVNPRCDTFLLTPVAAPAPLWLLGVGAAAVPLAAVRRRRGQTPPNAC